MWKILENEKGRHKVQKYRPSSDKELIEAPHLKFRKMLPIVSVTFYHDVGMQEFKAVARIERIRDGKKIVGERWRFCLSKPVNVQARGTQEGYTSEEIFRQRLVERVGAEFAQEILSELKAGIMSVEDEREPVVVKEQPKVAVGGDWMAMLKAKGFIK